MRHRLAAVIGLVLFAALPAGAAEPLRVTVDKAHLMRLDNDAGIVIVADPTVADVVLESPRLLFIVGRAPGETNLYILDGDGGEIVHTDLVVVPNADREVTLDRNTVEATFSCAPRCAQIATPGAAEEVAGAAEGAEEEASTADESAEAGG